MESLKDDVVIAAIRKALEEVQNGNAFMSMDLEEADFDKLIQGETEAVDKVLEHVSKELGKSLSPAGSPSKQKKKAAKKIQEMLLSQREKWLKVIQECGSSMAVKEKGEKHGADDMDVDSFKQEATPKMIKAESKDDSALVTGDTVSTNAGIKKEPTDMDVDETVKIKVETPTTDNDSPNKADTTADKKQPATDEANVKQESTPEDGKLKPREEALEKKSPDDMDVDTPVTKEDAPEESKKTSGKKRKSDDDKTKRKKSKGSKPSSAKKKKVGKKLRVGPSEAQMEKARETAKKEFEQEKAEILADLPDEYKKRWGQVGYCKWGREWLPCLIVGPFDVGHNTTMRQDWMTMYENTKNRRHHMTNIVYWYGSDDINSSFSIMPTSKIEFYDKGVQKGYNKLPKPIQNKINKQKTLTKADQQKIRAHEALAKDLEKQPQERVKFVCVEAHEDDEYIRSLLELELDDSGDELISSDDDEGSLSSASSSELDSDSDLDEKPKPKKTDKKPKKKEKEEEEMSFAEDEVSSDESKDEDVSLPGESSSSDDEADADYLVKEPGSNKRSSTKLKKKKDKGTKEKKKAGRPPKPKKEPKAETEYARNRAEHKKFRENKEEFLPILPKWKTAVKDKDLNAINDVLQDVLERVDSMGAPFMEQYNISPLMGATKKVLKEKNADRTTHKKLMTRLGELHKSQKPLVPKSFKPNLSAAEKNKKRKEKDNMPAKKAKKAKREEKEVSSSLNRNESTSSLPGSLPGSQPSTAPVTPVKRVYSQGSSSTPRDSQSVGSPKPAAAPRTAKSTSQRTEKTSFSLSSLFNPKPTSSQPKSDADASDEKPSSQTVTVKSLPSWMTAETPENVGDLPSEQLDRLFALEFFRGVTSCFPEDKVNREAIARALESAVYQWSLEQYRKEDTYWPKLHAVVAGICGKRKPGTLVAAIMAGEYKSARDIVLLSDEMLLHSFEGS